MAIPRIYHFIFGLKPQVEAFHPVHYLCLLSCIGINRPDAVMFHFIHEPFGPLWDRIKPALTLRPWQGVIPLDQLANDPESSFRYAHESDFVRLDVLAREGGVYADMDTLFVRPMPESLFQHDCVMGHETVDRSARPPARGSLCNALIMAIPGAQFIEIWRQRMAASFDGSWSAHSTFLPYQLSVAHPTLIHVEPRQSFFHLDWTAAGIRQLFEQDVPLPEGVYSLHLWAHLWWRRSRRDVSRFHQGRLTPAYLRHARTTYARISRQCLPGDFPRPSLLRYWFETAHDWLTLFRDRIADALRRKWSGQP